MTGKFSTQTEYLNNLEPEKRQVLQHLRTLIKETFPETKECISYSLPAFRYRGKILVGYGTSAKHCALYLFSASILNQFKDELAGFDTSKGTLRFQPASPPSKELIMMLIQAKIREIKA